MRSTYFASHALLPLGQSLWFDVELYCLTLLGEDQRIEQQCAMTLEALTILADLFTAYPTPLACNEQTQLLLATCDNALEVFHLTIERVSSGRYQLTTRPPAQEHPIQHHPHPLVYLHLDWRRGMYTIPPFLL